MNAGTTHPRVVWLDSLQPGGRLLLPITASADEAGIGAGGVFLITRRGDSFAARFVSEILIFPCQGARDPELNRQLACKGRPEWTSVRSLRRDPHEPRNTCWLHAEDSCLSSCDPISR